MSKSSSSSMNIIVPVVALVAIAGAGWYLLGRDPEVVTPPPAPVEQPKVEAPKPAEPADVLTNQEPKEDAIAAQADDAGADVGDEQAVATTTPLPALDGSDAFVKEKLMALKWKPGLASLFVTDEMIRRFVVQVDNIAEGRIALQQQLLHSPKQDFKAKAEGDNYRLDPANYARYNPYLDLLESVPAEQVAAVYRELYPLLQAAYSELGYGDAQFKDKLQQAMKVLINSPEIADAPALKLSSVYYSFADDETEKLSQAHKQMIRLGQKNQLRFKRLLAQYQTLLAK